MQIRIDKDGNVTGDVDQITWGNKVMLSLQGKDPKDGKGDKVTVGGDVILKKGTTLGGTVRITIQDGKIHFDYRMRPGIVRKSNAIELMRSVGLEV